MLEKLPSGAECRWKTGTRFGSQTAKHLACESGCNFHSAAHSALALETGHFNSCQSTGCDVFKTVQIPAHIKGKPVHTDPAPDAHSDGGKFAFSRPHPRQALADAGLYSDPRTQFYQPFLQNPQMTVQILAATPQIQHGIPHQLTGAVIGVLPAAAGLVHREARVEQVARLRRRPGVVFGLRSPGKARLPEVAPALVTIQLDSEARQKEG